MIIAEKRREVCVCSWHEPGWIASITCGVAEQRWPIGTEYFDAAILFGWSLSISAFRLVYYTEMALKELKG